MAQQRPLHGGKLGFGNQDVDVAEQAARVRSAAPPSHRPAPLEQHDGDADFPDRLQEVADFGAHVALLLCGENALAIKMDPRRQRHRLRLGLADPQRQPGEQAGAPALSHQGVPIAEAQTSDRGDVAQNGEERLVGRSTMRR